MGSTRLPGKVMLPLGCEYVLERVVRGVRQAGEINQTIVATSSRKQDDIIARYAPGFGVGVYRGSESDVLLRMFEASKVYNADIIVRITADCPLVNHDVIDVTISTLRRTGADYCSNVGTRTFPRGLDVEAFTYESFSRVEKEATKPHHREHVTPYYREHPDEFDLETVTSEMVFTEPTLQDREDLRLTLDEANDYDLLDRIFTQVPHETTPRIIDVIEYIDENRLDRINKSIKQTDLRDASGDSG